MRISRILRVVIVGAAVGLTGFGVVAWGSVSVQSVPPDVAARSMAELLERWPDGSPLFRLDGQ
jgi:hypothetical protein